MATKIARGTTKQASLTNNQIIHTSHKEPCGGDNASYIAFVNSTFGGKWGVDNSSINESNPQGWFVSDSGTITIPMGATLGNYVAYAYLGDAYEIPYPPEPGKCEVVHTYNNYAIEVVCMTVEVSITKLSSAPVPSSSPVQYEHKYIVQAETQGGTDPKTYTWSTDVGSISASGPSGILTVTNSNPTASGITGTVTCDVTDSSSPTCNAEGSASITDGKPTIEGYGPCVVTPSGNYQRLCCAAGKCPPCPQGTGNNIVSGGSDPNNSTDYGEPFPYPGAIPGYF